MSVSAFIFFPTLWRERNTSPLPYLAVNPEAVLYCGCRSSRETDWGCRNDVPVVIFWQSLDYRNFHQTGHYPGFLYLIVIYLWLFLELADYCCDCATDSYIAVADLGEGPRLPPLILGKKEEMTEGKKASGQENQNPGANVCIFNFVSENVVACKWS